MRTYSLSAFALVALLGLGACNDANRTDDRGLVQHDEDQFPGNDNEEELGPEPASEAPELGTVNSYGRGDDEGENETYSNIFRRDADDAENSTYTTDDDADFPHVDRPGDDLNPDGRAGLALDSGGVDRDRSVSAAEDPSASTIERYAPQDTEDASQVNEIGDPQDNAPYGNNIAVDGPTINEEQAAARDDDDGEPDFNEGIGGGQQTAIGAVGTANDELREYYDTDEEDYVANAGSDGESWGSWYRPLDPYERGFNERTIQLGGALEEGQGLDARYQAIQRRLYDVPENQQSVVYAPNNYTYNFLTSWDGLAVSAEGEADDEGEVAYDRPPLMGSGCGQADDPVTCSSTELDASLRRFLNDPRVLRDLMRAGVDGVSFDVDTSGNVKPESVRATASGRTCVDGSCERFNRALGKALRRQEWEPGTRFGRTAEARVNLALKYRQTEEQVDFDGAEETQPLGATVPEPAAEG